MARAAGQRSPVSSSKAVRTGRAASKARTAGGAASATSAEAVAGTVADELADTAQGLAVSAAITKSDPAVLVRGSLFSAEAAQPDARIQRLGRAGARLWLEGPRQAR